jgi:hypothetical protein
MGNWGWLPTPFLAFTWLEQIGELLDGENAFPLILAHHPCRHPIEQTKVVLLLSLGVTQALKGAQRTVLIQDNGRWCGRVHRDPLMEGLKKRSEGFGTRSQFDRVRPPVYSNDSSCSRRRVLETFQNVPDKGQLQLLFCADAVRPYKN